MRLKAVPLRFDKQPVFLDDVLHIAMSEGKKINRGNDIKVIEVFKSDVLRGVYVALLGCANPSVVEKGNVNAEK